VKTLKKIAIIFYKYIYTYHNIIPVLVQKVYEQVLFNLKICIRGMWQGCDREWVISTISANEARKRESFCAIILPLAQHSLPFPLMINLKYPSQHAKYYYGLTCAISVIENASLLKRQKGRCHFPFQRSFNAFSLFFFFFFLSFECARRSIRIKIAAGQIRG